MSILINILLVLHVIVSIMIILVTLMQRPKNEGLGAAFGGGVTSDLFGAQASNVLVTFTRWLGGIFFGLTILLSVLYARTSSRPSEIRKQLESAPRVVATATPASKEGVAKSGSSAGVTKEELTKQSLMAELQRAAKAEAEKNKGQKAGNSAAANVKPVVSATPTVKSVPATPAPTVKPATATPTPAPTATATPTPAPTATATPTPTATPAPAATGTHP